MDNGNTNGGDLGAAFEWLPDLFIKVTDFIGTALAVRGSYDNVAYWVEQTFKTVQKLGKASSIGTPLLSFTTVESPKSSWAKIAALSPPPTSNEIAL